MSEVSRYSGEKLFDNLPEYLTTTEVATLLGYKRRTVYEWNSKKEKFRTPKRLFHKFKRRLYVRRDVLRQWFLEDRARTRRPSL